VAETPAARLELGGGTLGETALGFFKKTFP
jgi:hypothetical protein